MVEGRIQTGHIYSRPPVVGMFDVRRDLNWIPPLGLGVLTDCIALLTPASNACMVFY